ncbi:MAG: glycosyl hydrolase [Lewinellaceae bacterium]|nr:glycosyl hydrolase [Lewinellaceae bacterium]
MRLFFTLLLCTFALTLFAQNEHPPFTAAAERMASYPQRQALAKQSIVNAIEFRNVGPTIMSGRVADLDVRPDDPTYFYVAYASGGLWKTENNGTSFEPLFDNEMVMTIGDIAVDWARNTIWVGTGEVNSSRSSYAGAGVYKSTDGGKSWQQLGLAETHHIGRIVLDPDNPNIAWVAALGHLYSPNEERGVFKTTDGGLTWSKTLYIDEHTGAVDLIRSPTEPNTLYAATWQRERRAWNFVESGPGSGIYKSTDGGESWDLLTTETSGFVTGEGAGRIGLDAVKTENGLVLFAAIDNYNRRPKKEEEERKLTKEELRSMSREEFLKLEKYLLKEYLQQYDFPERYDADKVRSMVEKGEIQPKTLVDYVEDANAMLFDVPVTGLELYRSDDGGQSWKRTHEDFLDNVYYTYGYYFGQVRVDPQAPDKVFVMGVPVLRSDDGGQSFESIDGDNVHGDHHALWINPRRAGHLILGNDGGVNISYDYGKSWVKCNTPAVGQFYAIAVDMAEPYRVYGGLQDNGVWMGPSNYRAGAGWHDSGRYPYRMIQGGDGMQVAVDTRDNTTVYTGYQFGNYFRIDTQAGKSDYITPKPKLGERAYRWNWQAPIHLSVHNQDILYMGANKLLRSLNQGKDFEEISGDLTQGGLPGDVPFGALSSIHESPLQFGLIYTGSDDGLVHLTRDGGYSWENISAGLPANRWVSRVQASAHEKGRVYVSLNGYRWDDFTPYLYVSDDYGQSWRAIGQDLPLEPINVVKEDPDNPNILYVGSDHGLYVSLDRGESFMQLNNQLPAVAVHDLVIQPRAHDLAVGTHGRSIYIASVRELQQLTPEVLAEALHVFAPESIRYSSRWGNPGPYRKPEPPKVEIPLYTTTAGKAKVSIIDGAGLVLRSFEADCRKGLNFLPYDLIISEKTLTEYNKILNKNKKKEERPANVKPAKDGKAYLYRGKYKVVVEKDGQKGEVELEVK